MSVREIPMREFITAASVDVQVGYYRHVQIEDNRAKELQREVLEQQYDTEVINFARDINFKEFLAPTKKCFENTIARCAPQSITHITKNDLIPSETQRILSQYFDSDFVGNKSYIFGGTVQKVSEAIIGRRDDIFSMMKKIFLRNPAIVTSAAVGIHSLVEGVSLDLIPSGLLTYAFTVSSQSPLLAMQTTRDLQMKYTHIEKDCLQVQRGLRKIYCD